VIGGAWLWRVLAVAALLGGLYMLERHIEQRGYDRAEADYTAAIERLHADAAAKLAEEVNKTRAAEQALNEAKNNQELKDATHTQTIASLSDRLRRAAGPAGRLRDPNATHCGGSGGSPEGGPATTANAGAADHAEAGGLLSEQLSELLQRLAREADDINAAYASCRADAYTVRAINSSE
jgi:hypothetical protein